MSTTTLEKPNTKHVNENIDKAARKVHEVTDEAKSEAKDKYAKVSDLASAAKAQIKEKYEHASDLLQDGMGNVREYVQKNPIKSLGIALLVGSAIAAIINRK